MVTDLRIDIATSGPLRNQFVTEHLDGRYYRTQVTENSVILLEKPFIRELGLYVPGPEDIELILRVVSLVTAGLEAGRIGKWLFEKLAGQNIVQLKINGVEVPIDADLIADAIEGHLRQTPRKVKIPKATVKEKKNEEV